MLYGENKTREIARSVLPSSRRKKARMNAASAKRRNRRRTNMTLLEWKGMENAYDFEGHVFDYIYGWSEDENIKMNVWERRNSDKLGALMRWAPAVTKHLDEPVDRYMFIKNVMPDNLIGRHALSHVKFLDGFDPDPLAHRYARWDPTAAKRRAEADIASYAKTAEAIILFGGHRELNRRIRRVHSTGHIRNGTAQTNCDGCPLRLLHGLHDTTDFVASLYNNQYKHPADFEAFKAFAAEMRSLRQSCP